MRAAKWTSCSTIIRREFSLKHTFQHCINASSISYEFGGPAGVTAMMIGFPLLMYYLWICLWFYDGKLVYPTSTEDIVPFLERMWTHVRDVCTCYS